MSNYLITVSTELVKEKKKTKPNDEKCIAACDVLDDVILSSIFRDFIAKNGCTCIICS